MSFFIAFLEGIITFISPCLLPMLPVYLTYFANGESNRKKTLTNAVAFVLGFTLVFVSLGAFAGGIGGILIRYKTVVNLVTGAIVIVFGLNFAGVFKIGFLNQTKKAGFAVNQGGFFSTMLFGMIFSIGWTPCVGAFLGSALLMASQKGEMVEGILMLLVYSIGLGIPFILSALLLDRFKSTFDGIKKHYKIINRVSGGLLVLVGILMMTGWMDSLMGMLQR